MTRLPEFPVTAAISSFDIHPAKATLSGEFLARSHKGETVHVDQHPLDLIPHLSKLHGRNKTRSHTDETLSKLNIRAHIEQKPSSSPETELNTPALTYLATPSPSSNETLTLYSPEERSGPSITRRCSPVFNFAAFRKQQGDSFDCPADSATPFDAIGPCIHFKRRKADVCSHDELSSDEDAVHLHTGERERPIKDAEEIQDIFCMLWRSRRPKDCRVFFQASPFCPLNGFLCPSCDQNMLVGSYQCATTMKPFPQSCIDAFLKHPRGNSGTKRRTADKRVASSLAQTGSAYPLSGSLPYLHPVTTSEVCILCTNVGCDAREIKKIDRVDFTLPLQEENYRLIFRDWLFTEEQIERDYYDGLFSEPAAL